MPSYLRAYLAFATLCLLSLGFPLYPLIAARMPVLIGGLPFALWWNVGWVTASFLALLWLDHAHGDAP